MQLSGSGFAVRRAHDAARALNARAGDPELRESHARGGGDDNSKSCKARAHAQVETVVVDGVGGVEALELTPHIGAHEHADGADTQHVLQVVVLLLVALLPAQQPPLAPVCEALPELDDAVGVIPAEKLRARDRDRGGALHGRENLGEGPRFWGRVFAEQPEPVLGLLGGRTRRRV